MGFPNFGHLGSWTLKLFGRNCVWRMNRLNCFWPHSIGSDKRVITCYSWTHLWNLGMLFPPLTPACSQRIPAATHKSQLHHSVFFPLSFRGSKSSKIRQVVAIDASSGLCGSGVFLRIAPILQGSSKDTFCNHLKHGFFHQSNWTPLFTNQCSGV